ncbi:MAG: hypothetical protein AAB803_02955 [Patescibacteria group bacterium]
MNAITLRKQLFYTVRDIPYQINTRERDTCCRSKTKILADLFIRIGLKARIATGRFFWKDIGLPQSILQLAPTPTEYHFFLRVYIPESKKWISVDPTWDVGLKTALPIAEWDGFTNTVFAVPIRRFTILKKNSVYVAPYAYPFTNFDPNDSFTRALNTWYASLRKGGI